MLYRMLFDCLFEDNSSFEDYGSNDYAPAWVAKAAEAVKSDAAVASALGNGRFLSQAAPPEQVRHTQMITSRSIDGCCSNSSFIAQALPLATARSN